MLIVSSVGEVELQIARDGVERVAHLVSGESDEGAFVVDEGLFVCEGFARSVLEGRREQRREQQRRDDEQRLVLGGHGRLHHRKVVGHVAHEREACHSPTQPGLQAAEAEAEDKERSLEEAEGADVRVTLLVISTRSSEHLLKQCHDRIAVLGGVPLLADHDFAHCTGELCNERHASGDEDGETSTPPR